MGYRQVARGAAAESVKGRIENHERGRVERMIQEYRGEGVSYAKIAKALDAAGLHPPGVQGANDNEMLYYRGAAAWSATAVLRIARRLQDPDEAARQLELSGIGTDELVAWVVVQGLAERILDETRAAPTSDNVDRQLSAGTVEDLVDELRTAVKVLRNLADGGEC